MSRLQQLEDELNEIGIRLKPPEKDLLTVDSPLLLTVDRTISSEIATWRHGENRWQLLSGWNNWNILLLHLHAENIKNTFGLNDDVSIIRESAKAKALAAMRDELQPRPPSFSLPASPLESSRTWDSQHYPPMAGSLPRASGGSRSILTEGADVIGLCSQQPAEELDGTLPFANSSGAGPWKASSSAAAAPSWVPSAPSPDGVSSVALGTTWEGQKSAALLALEGERRQIQVRGAYNVPSIYVDSSIGMHVHTGLRDE